MKRERSSITAQGIAAIRAIESGKPPDERICYDPLARQIVNPIFYILAKLSYGYGERRAPGTVEFITARTRFIDDYLGVCLDNGIEQLVILGAGLDSRAYRSNQHIGLVQVFEVDHPATQREKRKRLHTIIGKLPGHVTFVPIDFNEENLEKLYGFGYQKQRKTLFIWEGVTYYLTAEAVENTLKFVVKNSGGGSSIIFDYVYTSALTTTQKRGEIARMQRYGKFTGEALTFSIDEGKIGELLCRLGFTETKNVTSDDLKRMYFSGVNRDKPIAAIYAIVCATVDLTN
jgi:methyltransferase (TIGR00027 family)